MLIIVKYQYNIVTNQTNIMVKMLQYGLKNKAYGLTMCTDKM